MRADRPSILWQPIVELCSGRVVGHEALARFADGRGPEVHFCTAARRGCALALDVTCRNMALAAPPERGLLFLNLHPASVRELAAGAASLDAGGVEPARIVWELPERRGWPDGAADGIRSALPAGSRIALDDIGEGHADLSRWLRLRPDWIKLARSLVAGLAAEPVRRILIEGLVHAAAASGCQTVAEGVERHEDAACLLDLGVRFGQGYLWGRLGAVAGAEPAQAAR